MKVKIVQNHSDRVKGIDMKEPVHAEHPAEKKSSFSGRKAALIGITGALAIFVIVSLMPRSADIIPYSLPNTMGKLTFVDIEKVVSEKTAEYLTRNRKIYEDFKKESATLGEAEYNRALAGIEDAVDELSGFKTTAKLCYKMAKDSICDSNDTQEAILDAVDRPVLRHCNRGSAEVQAGWDRFEQAILESRNQYHADLSQYLNKLDRKDIQPGQRTLLDHLTNVQAKGCELAAAKAGIALGVAVEALCIRSTLKMLSSTCGFVVRRLISTASASAISAAADGPLPIGDVIGSVIFVGGVVWCASDIRDVSKKIPDQLEAALKNMVVQTRTEARKQVLLQAKKLTVDCEKEALALKEQVN